MHSGQRQGEAFGFSPDDVDEDAMVAHIRRQLQWTKNGKPYFKLPKGKKERDVPLSCGLLKRINAHQSEFPAVEVTLPWVGPGNNGRPTATVRLLATSHWGNRLKPNTFNTTVMKPALVEAGLIAPNGGKKWGWEASREMMHHRWRHTYASVQLAAGEDIVSVSHWLGHASVAITLLVYAHFMPDNGERGRTAVDSWLESGRAKAATAVDLRDVEALGFSTASELMLPASDAMGPRELVVVGARYGGTWAVGVQLEVEGAFVGEIRTEAGTNPDRALATGLAWVEEYCQRNGMVVDRAESLNHQFPAEVRPFQARGRLVLVPDGGES
ncbi:tyrosine-type recombinase/integrase [Streptomyces sp. NPDC001642]|uniref:tyrosine-type recombinase/integrase n=1 Tax=Streptomyces sp. NPDC001642 TaxID=3154392 RepID=UPI00331B84C1